MGKCFLGDPCRCASEKPGWEASRARSSMRWPLNRSPLNDGRCWGRLGDVLGRCSGRATLLRRPCAARFDEKVDAQHHYSTTPSSPTCASHALHAKNTRGSIDPTGYLPDANLLTTTRTSPPPTSALGDAVLRTSPAGHTESCADIRVLVFSRT